MKEVTINIPKDKMQEVGVFLEKEIKMNSIILNIAENCSQFTIYLPQSKVRDLLQKLDTIGCGTSYGIIKISNINAMKPVPKETNNLTFKTSGTLSLEQIYSLITSNIDLTFDYITYTIVSSIIASLGLCTNSVVMIVASMLLSPIMGPILGFTLGIIIKDWFLIKRSLKTELVSLLLIFMTAFIIGLIFGNYADSYEWPTVEMMIRGQDRDILVGFLLALPTGIAVGLSVTTGGINNFVGVAVAASLVPALANAGLLLAHGMMIKIHLNNNSNENFSLMGLYSFLIFLLNVIIISLVGLIVFRLKKIKSFRRTSTMWKFPKITDHLGLEKKPEISEFMELDEIIIQNNNNSPIALQWADYEQDNEQYTDQNKQDNLISVVIDDPQSDQLINELKEEIVNKFSEKKDLTKGEIREIIKSNPRIKTTLHKAIRGRVEKMRELKREEEQAEKELDEKLKASGNKKDK